MTVTDADGEGRQVALVSLDPIISPAWSPGGKELAYVSFESQKAVVWVQDVTTGQRRMLTNCSWQQQRAGLVARRPRLALTLSRDAVAQLYLMPREGGTPRRLTTSNAIDTEPAFSPDGQTFASGGDDNAIILWAPKIQQSIGATLTNHTSTVKGLAFNPSGQILACGADDGDNTIILCDVKTRKTIGTPLRGHTAGVWSVAFSPDGQTLAYGSCGKLDSNGYCLQGEIILATHLTPLDPVRAGVPNPLYSEGEKPHEKQESDLSVSGPCHVTCRMR